MPINEVNINIEAKSTRGEDIRNENVTPNGNPAEVKPINIGMLEQLQKGVIVPSSAPNRLPFIPRMPPRIFLVLSGGK